MVFYCLTNVNTSLENIMALKLIDEEPVSNCCTALFTYPGWPDSDFCSVCHEHAGIEEEK